MSEAKQQLTIKDSIRQQESHYAALLKASGTDVNRFMNNALMAASDHKEINSGEVDRASVFKVCSRAANDGVVLDGKQAAMIIGWNNKTKQKEAQYRLMAGGVMAMISRSSNIQHVACQIVYEGDDCTIDFVTDGQPVQHTINLRNRRGKPLGVYFVAKLKNGGWTSPEYMSEEEINEVRDNYSQKDKDGKFSKMWLLSPGEAWRKTILHRAKKRLPLDESIESALSQDDPDYELRDVTPDDDGETPKPKKASSKEAVKQAITQKPKAPTPEADEDGVIIEHEDDGGYIDADYDDMPPV